MIQRILPILLLALMSSGIARSAEPTETALDEEAGQAKVLSEGRRLLDSGKPGDAITNSFNKVIAYFDVKYRDSKRRIYCGHDSLESTANLLVAATNKQEAVVIGGTWADACFLKGFALMDLHRSSEGRSFLERAVALSPTNPQYLCELGYAYQLEKNWAKADEMFKTAEGWMNPNPSRQEEVAKLTRALRGQAYVLVELEKLAQAEKLYQRCLKLDPNDKTAKAELNYVRRKRDEEKQSKPVDQ